MLSTHRAVAGFPHADWQYVDAWTLDDVSPLVTAGVWSHCVWAGGKRTEDHFAASMWCVLDFDEGVTKREAAALFCDYAFLLGPTRNDGVEKETKSGIRKAACDRFRVVLKFSTPIYRADLFRYNMKRTAQHFGSDTAATDAARVWQPCSVVETVQLEGKCIDVATDIPLEETEEYQAKKLADYTAELVRTKRMPKRVKEFMRGKIQLGERNNEAFYACAMLFQFGWKVDAVRKLLHGMPILEGMDNLETTIRSAARRVGAAYF